MPADREPGTALHSIHIVRLPSSLRQTTSDRHKSRKRCGPCSAHSQNEIRNQAPQGNSIRKKRCGMTGLIALVKIKFPLRSKLFVAIGVQLVRGNATFVEAST